MGHVRTLDFSIQARCSWFYVRVSDSQIYNVPVKFRLKLMTVIGSDRVDSEGKFSNSVIYKIYRISLSMFVIDFQSSNMCGIINGCVLKTAMFLSRLVFQI